MDECKNNLNENKEVILLKLGGGLLTDKNTPFSLREEVIDSAIQQIIESEKKIILIHGGGSFGHPLAKKYDISNGINSSVENQILGLAETHEAMNKFNSVIINKFIEKKVPALSIQASSIFIKRSNKTILNIFEPIELCLNLNIIPILYGDIIFDASKSFSILSGDEIALELCRNLNEYVISKVIYAMETDGIWINDEEDGITLCKEINSDDLNSLNLASLEKKIDITGGIRGKINSIKNLCECNVQVQLINGLKHNYILKALKNQELECTKVIK